jgi:arginine deiminase
MSDKKTAAKKSTSTGDKKVKISRTAKPDPAVAEREQWATLRPAMKVEQAKAYDMDGNYRTKALVNHSHFGLGVVTSLAGSRKMEVLFEEGKKLLRCQ